ncbi:hypothetical protein [Streptomyces platensis]|uniref:hypothetical protein n=1 Tax=Streptomyces platensis TaxID=58346 RepID=UPI0038640DEF|nr:hypothetical protein OG962_20715 [Streptomyces platensis]
MPQQRIHDLVAFISILLTTLGLIALGVRPDQIVGLATALGVLYSAWRSGNSGGQA